MSFLFSSKSEDPLITSKDKPKSSPDIKDEDTIILNLHSMKYTYFWYQLKKYPKFWITKHILNGRSSREFQDDWTCPELYGYINRYISYGIPLSLKHISNQFHCKPKDVILMLGSCELGKEIFEDSVILDELDVCASKDIIPSLLD